MRILDPRQKHYRKKSVSTYHELRRQVESLTPDEQLRLLEELAGFIRAVGYAYPQALHN